MPEIHNPNLQSRNPDDGHKRSLWIFAVLAFVILFGYPYLVKPKPTSPTQTNQAQRQTERPTDAHRLATGGQSGLAGPRLFADPKAINVLASIPATAVNGKTTGQSLQPPVHFGWLTVIAEPLYLALRFLYEHGIGNWGWAIIILTVIFNLLMLWPRMMSMRSSLKMMRVQPKAEALKKRYAHLKMNDPKRTEMNTELMALYKAEGANMYGGCLPMLLQMPLLFAYFRVLQNAAELHQAHWFWLTDLSSPDPLHILPIVIIMTMTLTQFITPSPGMDPTQRRVLAFVMPVTMGFTLWRYASGLPLIWCRRAWPRWPAFPYRAWFG